MKTLLKIIVAIVALVLIAEVYLKMQGESTALFGSLVSPAYADEVQPQTPEQKLHQLYGNYAGVQMCAQYKFLRASDAEAAEQATLAASQRLFSLYPELRAKDQQIWNEESAKVMEPLSIKNLESGSWMLKMVCERGLEEVMRADTNFAPHSKPEKPR